MTPNWQHAKLTHFTQGTSTPPREPNPSQRYRRAVKDGIRMQSAQNAHQQCAITLTFSYHRHADMHFSMAMRALDQYMTPAVMLPFVTCLPFTPSPKLEPQQQLLCLLSLLPFLLLFCYLLVMAKRQEAISKECLT